MREPVTSIRSLVGTVCATAGATAKAKNAPPAINCITASRDAFTIAIEDTSNPYLGARVRRTFDPMTPTLQQRDLPPQRKPVVSYNGRIEVVVNLSSMRVRRTQAADSPAIAAVGWRSVSRCSAVTTKRFLGTATKRWADSPGTSVVVGVYRHDQRVGPVAYMYLIDGADGRARCEPPIVSRAPPGFSLDA